MTEEDEPIGGVDSPPTQHVANPLSFPSLETGALSVPSTSAPVAGPPRALVKDRLYVGNLHPSVDEYTLITTFAKFGTISKLDFLFHRAGSLKGKPRGFAFVQYANPSDASRAISQAHDKPLRGRPLVVTFAQQAPADALPSLPALAGLMAGGESRIGDKKRRLNVESAKPTTLSLLKTAPGRHDRMDNKIARMEAKLAQLASTPEVPGGESHKSTNPAPHPSLPEKPTAASIMAAETSSTEPPTKKQKVGGSGQRSGPTLELARRAAALAKINQRGPSSAAPSPTPPPGPKLPEAKSAANAGRTKAGIAGVKIVKKKAGTTGSSPAVTGAVGAEASNSLPESA